MAVSRTRTRTFGEQDRGEVRVSLPNQPTYIAGYGIRTAPLIRNVCQDVVGSPKTDNVLLIEKESLNMQSLNGVANISGGSRTYSNVGPSPCRAYSNAVLPPAETNNALRIKALARTNPSRPQADLGVSLVELRELPQLLQSVGSTMLRKGAGNYLSIQFGWTPLVSDIIDVLDFQKHVGERVQRLQDLHDGDGLKRRISLGTQTATGKIENFAVCSVSGRVFQGNGTATATRKSWATVRYKPIIGNAPKTDKQILKDAIKATYGLTVDASTAWNLIPWSWMGDWFSNCGDWLEANRNIIGAQVSSCCVMTHTRQEVRITSVTPPPDHSGIGGGTQYNVKETKARSVGTMTLPELDLGPAISPYRASILGALGVNAIPKGLLK